MNVATCALCSRRGGIAHTYHTTVPTRTHAHASVPAVEELLLVLVLELVG